MDVGQALAAMLSQSEKNPSHDRKDIEYPVFGKLAMLLLAYNTVAPITPYHLPDFSLSLSRPRSGRRATVVSRSAEVVQDSMSWATPSNFYAEWPDGLKKTMQGTMMLVGEDPSLLNQCRDLLKQLNKQREELDDQIVTTFSDVIGELDHCEAKMWAKEAGGKAATFFVAAILPQDLMKGRIGSEGERKDLPLPALDSVPQEIVLHQIMQVGARKKFIPTYDFDTFNNALDFDALHSFGKTVNSASGEELMDRTVKIMRRFDEDRVSNIEKRMAEKDASFDKSSVREFLFKDLIRSYVDGQREALARVPGI
jgi:hypothetical protein